MAWSVRQSQQAFQTVAALSLTATYSDLGAPVAGNKLIACLTLSSGGINILSNVKDGAGNTLTAGMTAINNSGSLWQYMYFLDAPASPSTTIVANWASNATDAAMVILEVSGLLAGNTTACLDGTYAGGVGTATPTGTVAYSSTALNEFLLTQFGDFGNGALCVAPSGYSLDGHSVNSSGTANCCVAYKNSTNGAEADSWTYTPTTGDQWVRGMVAFKLAAAGAAAIPAQPVVPVGAVMRSSRG